MKKKILSIALAITLIFTLVGCNNKANKKGMESDKNDKKTEEVKDNKNVKMDEDASEIAKVGVSFYTKSKASELKDDKGKVKTSVLAGVFAFDKDGKVVKASLDVSQGAVELKDDGSFKKPLEEISVSTKKELGDAYGMKKASKISKEWHEQITSLEEFFVGKTVEEIKAIPVEKRDEKHIAVPTDVDLKASVTITIDPYLKLVEEAWNNAVDVTGVDKLGFSLKTTIDSMNTSEPKDDKGAKVGFNSIITLVGIDKDGKVAKTLVDEIQNKVELGKDGKVVGDLDKEMSKKMMGDKYNMKVASKIGKEWNEQIEAFEAWTLGKTEEEISKLPVKDGKTEDADLMTSVTMKVSPYQEEVVKAIKAAK